MDEYPAPVERVRISVRTERVNALLGTDLDAEDVWDALAPLGIELDTTSPLGDAGTSPFSHGGGDAPTSPISHGGVLVATIPTFRPDLDRESTSWRKSRGASASIASAAPVPTPTARSDGSPRAQRDRRAAADALVGVGLSEAITLSLVAPADLERAGAPMDRLVRAANPLRAEESVLRTAILPGLLRAVAHNRSHGIPDVALFEVGRVFLAPHRARRTAKRRCPRSPSTWPWSSRDRCVARPLEADRPVDAYDAVDALRAVGGALRIDDLDLDAADATGYRPGRAATVRAGGQAVGRSR